MNADEILKKHEDANEMHFYEADRKWIIEAMEEYAALRQTSLISEIEKAYEAGKLDKEFSLSFDNTKARYILNLKLNI